MASWIALGRSGSASHAATAASSSAPSSATSIQAACPSRVATATESTSPVPARQLPWTETPTRVARGRVLVEPRGGLARGQAATVELEARLGLDGVVGIGVDRVEQPAAQLAAELELVEELEAGGAVPRLPGEAVGTHRQGQVAHERVELAVADDVAEVGAQRLALLAGDLVGAGDDVVEAVELVDPLRGVALADARHAGQVVGGLAHDGGELGVAVGRDAVLLLRPRPA